MSTLPVFLDTEFVETLDGPWFLSVALLSGDGREFYAELPPGEADALLRLHPSEFVRREVLPQLGRQPGAPWSELSTRLPAWLDGLGADEIDVVYDYNEDYLLLEQLFAASDKPPTTRLNPTHVGYLLDELSGKLAAAATWHAISSTRGLSRHHALADVHALRARFESVHVQGALRP